MEPSTASLAVGDGDHVTIAPAIPGSTFMEATLFGHMTVGASLSVLDKEINYNNIFDNHSILEKKIQTFPVFKKSMESIQYFCCELYSIEKISQYVYTAMIYDRATVKPCHG